MRSPSPSRSSTTIMTLLEGSPDYDYVYHDHDTFECQYMREGREHLLRMISHIHALNYDYYYQADEEVPEIPTHLEIMDQTAAADSLKMVSASSAMNVHLSSRASVLTTIVYILITNFYSRA